MTAPNIATAKSNSQKNQEFRISLPTKKALELEAKDDISKKIKSISETYPLIKIKIGKKVIPVAFAYIHYNKQLNDIIYEVLEPKIDIRLRKIIDKTSELLKERLEIDFSSLAIKKQVYTYIDNKIDEIWEYLGIKLKPQDIVKTKYYIFRDTIGLGRVEALMHDPNIEDISCNGIKSPVFIFHRNPLYSEMPTNISFIKKDDMDSFVMKLAQKSGRTISVATPLLDSTLPDGSRLQLTYGTDIARKGSNFSIRKFFRIPLTPIDILNFGTLNPLILAYLWLMIEEQKSILIAGSTATGKTTLLNSLCLFIAPGLKIVSIEDTAELQIPRINWLPQVARSGFGAKGYGQVDMFDLLKASMRQRPDYIIVGEVRGKEATVMFQAMASIKGNEKTYVIDNKGFPRIQNINQIKDTKNYKVPTFSENPGEITIANLKDCQSHSPRSNLIMIKTKTGREVISTINHSLLTIENNELKGVVVDNLKKGDKIAIPAKLPCNFKNIKHLNLIELLPNLRVIAPSLIKDAVRKIGYKKACKITNLKTISDCYARKHFSALKANKFEELMKLAKIKYDLNKLKIKGDKKSKTLSAKLKITNEFLRFLGYFIAEGSLNKAKKNNRIALYNKNPIILKDMKKCIYSLDCKIKERLTKGFGISTELSFSNKVLFEFLKKYCGDNSKHRKIPFFIFGLSKQRIGEFLKALWLGNGSINKKNISYWTSSRELANDLAYLLLTLGIVCNIKKTKGTNVPVYNLCIYKTKYIEEFIKYTKLKYPFKYKKEQKDKNTIKDIYLDTVKEINNISLPKEESVYDLCVPGTQNFIGGFGGILLHNTGHPGLSTLHADTVEAVIDRLTTKPIDLPASLLQNLDIIVFLERAKKMGHFTRKVGSIIELEGYDRIKKEIKTNETFKWKPSTDEFISKNSYHLAKIAEKHGWTKKQIENEILKRVKIIEWMQEEKLHSFLDAAKTINTYYIDQNKLFKLIKISKEKNKRQTKTTIQ